MKHIKRKFTHQFVLPDEVTNLIDEKATHVPSAEVLLSNGNIPDDVVAWALTDKKVLVKTFKYPHNGKNLFVPEPDPVLVYFNAAQINLRLIEMEGGRKELLNYLKEFKDLTKIMHSLYDFLAHSSAFAIFSFMAIECAANKIIPDNYYYKRAMKHRTEEFDSYQVQHMEFLDKINKVLPEITGKYFSTDHRPEYDRIISLKDLRNDFAHTKKQVKDETYYRDLFIRALDFDYSACLLSVKVFVNYHSADLIEECDCSADF